MSYFTNLLTFGAVWAVIVISPGPDMMVTIRLALSRSRRTALAAVLGICVGTAIWAAGAAMGLAMLAAQERWIIEVIRWCGAAYLLVLAIQIFRKANNPLLLEPCSELTRRRASGAGLRSAWRTGLFADLGNPKAAIFWASLFATTLPAGTPYWILVIAVIVAVLIAGSWYAIVAILFSIPPILRGYRRAKRWIDFATGGILLALAAYLISVDRAVDSTPFPVQ